MKTKRSLILLLSFVLLLGAAPAYAADSAAGVWDLSLCFESDTGRYIIPSDEGLSMTLTLNPDGNASLEGVQDGETIRKPLNWRQEDEDVHITDDGETITFHMVFSGDGYHSMRMTDSEGNWMLFRRNYLLHTMVPASSESQFWGEWTFSGIAMVMEGMGTVRLDADTVVAMEIYEEPPVLTITPGTVEFKVDGNTQKESVRLSGGRLIAGYEPFVELTASGEAAIRIGDSALYFVLSSSPERVPGDADSDGKPDAADALRILQSLAGQDVPVNRTNADVNEDGSVDLKDAVLILQYDAGWNVTLR